MHEVRHRTSGHQLDGSSTMLRFHSRDLNMVVNDAVAASRIYCELLGHPTGTDVLVLSCFAVTDEWPLDRLSAGTSYQLAYVFTESAVADRYQLVPTEVWIDGDPDPRNEVHYDLVIAYGPGLIPVGMAGTKSERRAARASLAPIFEEAIKTLVQASGERPAPSTADAVPSKQEDASP